MDGRNMSPMKHVLSLLQSSNPLSNGWLACCPAHDDHSRSLLVSEGDDGRILLTCFAGCTHDAIVGVLGLESQDLFVPHDKRNGTPLPTGKTISKPKSASGPKGTRHDTAEAPPPPGTKQLVNVTVVAAKYDCGERSVLRLADAGIIPFGIKLGSLRRWDLDEIDAHIAAGLPRVKPLTPRKRRTAL
jgi:hypothetical protein